MINHEHNIVLCDSAATHLAAPICAPQYRSAHSNIYTSIQNRCFTFSLKNIYPVFTNLFFLQFIPLQQIPPAPIKLCLLFRRQIQFGANLP